MIGGFEVGAGVGECKLGAGVMVGMVKVIRRVGWVWCRTLEVLGWVDVV